MIKALRTSFAIALAAMMAVVLVACGSSSSSSSSSSGSSTSSGGGATGNTPAGQMLTGGKKGGTLTVYNHEDFQNLDPGQASFVIDFEASYATQRPLYSYLPNQQTTLVPDLASGQPTISDGGKTVTVHIRPGVMFSPPLHRAVTSHDVAYAIERAANPNVAGAYFASYFTSLVGGDKAKGGPIPGIVTPDNQTIVFHLTKPVASILVGALGLPISAPVPPEFAKKYDAMKPTKYGGYQVATGPYMFKSDAQGKVTGIGYQTGKSATLVRNPNWVASTDFRPAYLDQININIGGAPEVIGRQVLTGTQVVQNDTPAQSIVKLAFQQHPHQILFVPGAGNRYVALNNKQGPFANVNLRRAFYAALNRTALVKARGGSLVADIGTHFLYPGTAGFDQAGGLAGPQVDFNKSLTGDMAVAAKYMKLAGYPGGKYTGGKTLTVVGSTGNPASVDAQIVNQTLQNLGFKTNFSVVDQPVMYGKFCGVPAKNVDVCPNVGWLRDFADPQTVLDPTFAGKNIVPANNYNEGQVNDPQINAMIDHAEAVVGDAARAAAWANVDTALVEKAVAVPWAFDKQPVIEAPNVRGINDLWNQGGWDYSYTSLK